MAGIVNMIANMLVPAKTAVSAPVRTGIKTEAMNPYANPFVSVKGSNPFKKKKKNKPVAGGYFAGYYNNKPNIVGQRLFVEV